MNASSLVGVFGTLIFLVVVILFGTDDPLRLVDWAGLAIVLCGTLAATFLSYPLPEVLRIFRLVLDALGHEDIDTRRQIEELVRISRLWIRGDLRAVEAEIGRLTNPFLKTGLQMVINNAPEADINDLLQWRVLQLKAKEAAEAQLFRVMSSYAPAFGMLGTLLGLVNLMDLLSTGNIRGVGGQLGIALMTTLYGVLLSNLFFKPIAVKLERRTERRLVVMNMILEGISMICSKRSPLFMQDTLNSFVERIDDELVFDGRARRRSR